MKTQFFNRMHWPIIAVLACLLFSSQLVGAQQEILTPLRVVELKSVSPGVTVEILGLKRTAGDTATLSFAVVNGTENEVKTVEKYFTSSHRSDVGKITLVDWENKKRYWVIRDSDNNCMCTRGDYLDHRIPPQGRKEFWIRFPAPPADVTQISIDIPGGFLVDGIPIGK